MQTRYLLLLFALLAAASFAVHHFVPAYLPVGDQLINNNTFSQGSRGWTKTGRPGTGSITIEPNLVTLKTMNQPTFLQLSQTIETKTLGKHVLFTSSAQSQNVIKGQHDWDKASIQLIHFINNKPDYTLNHLIFSLTGSTEWENYTRLLTIDPKAEHIAVKVQICNATGELQCRNISLYQAVQNPLNFQLRILLISGWGIFCIFLFWPYFNSTDLKTRLFTLLTLGVLLFGITMNGTLKNTIKAQIYTDLEEGIKKVDHQLQAFTIEQAEKAPKSPAETDNRLQTEPTESKHGLDITKLAHFVLFMALGLLLKINHAKTGRQIILDLILLACMTEMLQLFIDGRSALIHDVIIDLGGGLTGLGLAAGILASRSRPSSLPSTRDDS